MDCDVVRSLLLDHNLYHEDLPAIRASLSHLENCPTCREAVEDYAAIRGILGHVHASSEASAVSVASHPAAPRPKVIRTVFFASPTVFRVAAALLFALGAYWLGLSHAETEGRGGVVSSSPHVALLSSDAAKQIASGFREVSGVFCGQARWMLLSKNDSDVGLSRSDVISDKNVLVLRITLLRNGHEEKTTDVAMVSGSGLSTKLPISGGRILSLALSAQGEAMADVGLWVEVAEAAGMGAQGGLSVEVPIRSGATEHVGRFRAAGDEYEIRLSYASVAQQGAVL